MERRELPEIALDLNESKKLGRLGQVQIKADNLKKGETVQIVSPSKRYRTKKAIVFREYETLGGGKIVILKASR